MSDNSRDGPRGVGSRDRSKSRQSARKAGSKGGFGKVKATSDVGRALRSVYDSTLREEVPQDFLDLLGRLD